MINNSIDDITPSTLPTGTGILLESILNPLLFVLHMNGSNKFSMILYTDDTTLESFFPFIKFEVFYICIVKKR